MKLEVKPAIRWHVARPDRSAQRQAWRALNRDDGTEGDFSILNSELPASEDTRFKVYAANGEVVVAILLGDKVDRFDAGDSVEIFFDPYHDHVGYYQFYFPAGGAPQIFTHLPYDAAHSTTFPPLRLKGHVWGGAQVSNVVGVKERVPFLLARFERAGVFRAGPCCGFNVTRYSMAYREAQTWNRYTGHLFQDASGFGHLYAGAAPCAARLSAAEIENGRLALAGELAGGAPELVLEICDPLGSKQTVTAACPGGRWQAHVPLDPARAGRYRICPRAGGVRIEPEFFFFDLAAPNAAFTLNMTYDSPDDLRTGAYTPERLEKQIAQLAACGLSRIYWIEYPPYAEWSSFWDWASSPRFAREAFRRCGDVLPCAAEISKRLGLEFVGIFKPFDLGFTGPAVTDIRPIRGAARKGYVRDLDNRYTSAWPPLVAHPEWTLQTHPAWAKTGQLPAVRLRFESAVPLPPVKARDLRLWTSADNRDFKPYRGPVKITQRSARLPHCRWTPAGTVAESGTRKVWLLELEGLRLPHPYAAVTVKRAGFRAANRRFLLAAAFDAAGRPLPLTLGSGGQVADGFQFANMWSWTNYTEALVDDFAWEGAPLGLVFAERTRLPTVFEPAYPEVRALWLSQVERILKTAADGVDIRTLCHHNVCLSWLNFAFAPAVRDLFRERFGRDVTATPEDYERVRRLRGACYTDFIRQAKQLAVRYGKKLGVHLEPNVEVPVVHNVRFAMHLDWETWIREGLLDEITLKYWSAQSAFVHERILPLARKAGIRVYPSERNFALNTARGIELAEHVARDAFRAGFAGYSFYETASYFCLNEEGVSFPIGLADHALSRAAETVARERRAAAG